jgi:hypothetical protein
MEPRMNRRVELPKTGLAAIALGVVIILLPPEYRAFGIQEAAQQPPPPASSQQTAPSSQPAAAGQPDAKKRKVWTNEDLVALRTPADIYILEKEAREAAEAEAAEKEAAQREAAKAEASTAPEAKLPATQEETEKLISNKQGDLDEETAALAKLKTELPDTPAEQQPDKQKEIDRLSADTEALQRDLKALQEHLKKFAPKPEEQASPPPAGPPQSN